MRAVLTCAALFAALIVLAGCGGGQQATAVSFGTYTAQQVLDAIRANGIDIVDVERQMTVGRGAPNTHTDRYVFAVPRIAPAGGQVLIFTTQSGMQAWLDYVESLRNDRTTRRDVIYVYTRGNVIVQVNAELTNSEAEKFKEALDSLP